MHPYALVTLFCMTQILTSSTMPTTTPVQPLLQNINKDYPLNSLVTKILQLRWQSDVKNKFCQRVPKVPLDEIPQKHSVPQLPAPRIAKELEAAVKQNIGLLLLDTAVRFNGKRM